MKKPIYKKWWFWVLLVVILAGICGAMAGESDTPVNNDVVVDFSMRSEEQNDAKKILLRINARVRSLLNKDNQIGHSYLMFVKSNQDIFEAVTSKIIPLLEEYFYNDITKVRFVLNENEKTKYPFYQEDKEAKQAFDSFVADADLETEDKDFYELKYEVKKASDYDNYLKHLLGVPEP